MIKQLIWWNRCNWIIRWRISGLSVRVRTRPVELISLNPFDTFIACEFKWDSLSSSDDGSNIDEDITVDCVSCKVKIFIRLDKEISHCYLINIDFIAFCLLLALKLYFYKEKDQMKKFTFWFLHSLYFTKYFILSKYNFLTSSKLLYYNSSKIWRSKAQWPWRT